MGIPTSRGNSRGNETSPQINCGQISIANIIRVAVSQLAITSLKSNGFQTKMMYYAVYKHTVDEQLDIPRPQALTVPSVEMTTVWCCPVATSWGMKLVPKSITSRFSAISFSLSPRLSVSPKPSCPYSFQPQHLISGEASKWTTNTGWTYSNDETMQLQYFEDHKNV